MKTTDKILIIVFCFLIIYTSVALFIFSKMGLEPAVLTGCVFAACTGEAGICWRIWRQKDLRQQREWSKEDMTEQEKEGENDESDR